MYIVLFLSHLNIYVFIKSHFIFCNTINSVTPLVKMSCFEMNVLHVLVKNMLLRARVCVQTCLTVCVSLYLISEGLALAIGELWFHEGVAEECRHVVVLPKKNMLLSKSVVLF